MTYSFYQFRDKNLLINKIYNNDVIFFILRIASLLEVKRLEKMGTGGLKKIENFYLSQPITLHPQNSIFLYLRTYPELPGVYPLVYPTTEVVSIFFYIFLHFS